MSLKLAKEFVVLFGGEVIARCVDFTFTVNKRVIDLENLDTAGWKEIKADMKDWAISFNALIARTGARNYDAMLADIKNNDEYVTVAIGERVSGGSIEQGQGILTKVALTGRVADKASYSGEISGHGVLETTTMPTFEADFLTFSVPGQTGLSTINDTAKTVAIDVPALTDVTDLVATFTTSPSVIKVTVATKEQKSGTTANDFTDPVVYRVFGGDNTTIEDWTVTVTVAE